MAAGRLRRCGFFWIFAAVAFLAVRVCARGAGGAGGAGAVEVAPAVTVSLTVLNEPRPTTVLGDLVAYDDAGLTLDVRGERRTLAWVDLSSASAFTARYRLVDEARATDWLALGAFGRAVGAARQAEQALLRAVRLDPSLAAEADRIRATPADTLRRPPPVAPQPAAPAPPPVTRTPSAPRAGGDVQKFAPVTDADAQAAMAQARRVADADLRKLGVRVREVQTAHFLIFTDWDPVDDAFLADSLEGAYRLVSREFDVGYDQTVFVGKLPVYMFDAHDDFMRYAREIDGQLDFPDGVAGYYSGRSDGMGKMLMSKPRSTRDVGLPTARKLWARTLTHEFTHAFFARYRSNAFVPRWLNEGLAEVIAEQVYPRAGAIETAKAVARSGAPIDSLFDDSVMPPAAMYPVAMTLVQALYREDGRKFNALVDRIKAGDDPQTALRDLYRVDYAGLQVAWRGYVLRQ